MYTILQQHQLFIQVNGVQIANVNSIEIVVLSGTVTVGSFVAATQSCMTSYATDLTYIIATPGIQLVKNSNAIAFGNNGTGLVWGVYTMFTTNNI